MAAAGIFPPEVQVPGVADSKTLARASREALLEEINRKALAVGIGRCSPQEVDELNILWAAMEAMRRAAAVCFPAPDYLLIDGNRCFPQPPCPHETLVRGDARCHAIAAASIVAKTERDRLMRALHAEHPQYSWNTNVGYPTRAHYDALEKHGPTRHHRRSFRLTRHSRA